MTELNDNFALSPDEKYFFIKFFDKMITIWNFQDLFELSIKIKNFIYSKLHFLFY
jgi:hypothetical protein